MRILKQVKMDFESKSSVSITKVTKLILAYEQLMNVSKIIGYNESLHEVIREVSVLLQDEYELQNEQINFQEIECD